MKWVFIVIAIVLASVSQLSAANNNTSAYTDCIPANTHAAYLRIEKSLLSRPQNLVDLRQAFCPTNQQQSISVQIKYSFVNSSETVTYRWLQSSVLMLIRSDLLRYLSLFMYNVKTRYVNVNLDPICNLLSDVDDKISRDSSSYCESTGDSSTGHHLLNTLTANVSYIVYVFSYTCIANLVYIGVEVYSYA